MSLLGSKLSCHARLHTHTQTKLRKSLHRSHGDSRVWGSCCCRWHGTRLPVDKFGNWKCTIYSLHTNGGASVACAKINHICTVDLWKFGRVGPRRSMCLYFLLRYCCQGALWVSWDEMLRGWDAAQLSFFGRFMGTTETTSWKTASNVQSACFI